MKDEPIRYLGLDVHRSTVVPGVRDEQGKVVMKATVATEEKAIVALAKSAAGARGLRRRDASAVAARSAARPRRARGRMQRTRTGRAQERERPHRRRRDVEAAARRLAQAGLPRRTGELTLKELVRCYGSLVEDATRVMLRVKALFRARAIATPGVSVYRASQRKHWLAKLDGGARVHAESLLSQLDVLSERDARRERPAAGVTP